jgi:hypothetical protein
MRAHEALRDKLIEPQQKEKLLPKKELSRS